MNSLLSLAEKNLTKKFFRSMAIALSVTVVAATLFTVTTMMDSVKLSLKRGTARLGADIMVVPLESEALAKTALLAGEPSTFYMDRSIEKEVREVRGVKSSTSQVFLKTAKYQCCDAGDMLLIGYDPDTDFTIKSWLSGTLEKKQANDEIVMGRSLTAWQVGDAMRIYGLDFRIIGMLEETGMKFIDNSVFMPYEALTRIVDNSKKVDVKTVGLMEDQISTVLVQVDPELSPARVAIFIEANVDDVKAITSEQVISSVRKQLFVLLRSIISVSVILWVMALLLIGVVFSMIVNERKRELGMLRAMGARKTHIFKLIISEASILSLTGGILGIGLGGVTLYIFKGFIRSALNIPYLWPSALEFALLIVICLLLSLFTGVGAALFPALRATFMEPYDAIRRGE